MIKTEQIRNFSIIAHIDHGKSTIADRLIQVCGGLSDREMTEQVLDSMDIERERGITIKAQTVRLNYQAQDGKSYVLNLMDTPGHVDFGYEVSRSLSACEGSLLIVDASQGVEAQTLANVYQAIDADHEIVSVLNKIDLPAAEPERVKAQIEEVIGLPSDDAIAASAKTGEGIAEILEALVTKLPAPKGSADAPLQALLVDSWYDAYLGVMTLVRVRHGVLRKGMKIRMMATGANHVVERVGVFAPKPVSIEELGPGEIGFINAGVKRVADAKVGDTITEERRQTEEALPGFAPSVQVVFCGLFPLDANDFNGLRDALEKLSLNDASFSFEAETSAALGFGFRCGFLGLLHMEVIRERLNREFNLELISTAPSVVYRLPLNEVVFDFYDRLKSITRGYASFDYSIDSYREGDLVKVLILVNGDPVDALSMIVHRDQAEGKGRAICVRLKDLVPRQMFKVAIQAAIGGKVIARETIAALRKDVTAKCYGGDISRKKKLLEKQKEGKKKMRQFGKVEIPQNAFFEALKMGDN